MMSDCAEWVEELVESRKDSIWYDKRRKNSHLKHKKYNSIE